MKLVNIEIIKNELERLIHNYRFYWNTETKNRYEAYEDGYDKAVELACGFLHKVACGYAIRELLTGEPYEGKIIEDFKKYVEEEI